jgi:hypothetical protein
MPSSSSGPHGTLQMPLTRCTHTLNVHKLEGFIGQVKSRIHPQVFWLHDGAERRSCGSAGAHSLALTRASHGNNLLREL